MVAEINVFQLLTNVRISNPVEMTGLRIFLFAIAKNVLLLLKKLILTHIEIEPQFFNYSHTLYLSTY